MPSIQEILTTMSYEPHIDPARAAHTWLEASRRTFKLFVAGRWTSPRSAPTHELTEVFNGEVLAEVTLVDHKEIDSVLKAARRGSGAWAALTAGERAVQLKQFAKQVSAKQLIGAELGAQVWGRALHTASVQMAEGVAQLEQSPSLAHLCPLVYKQHAPAGLVVLFWGEGVSSAACLRALSSSLAAGCGVVIIPALHNALHALLLADAAHEAGGLMGALSVITCLAERDLELLQAVTEYSAVRQVTFLAAGTIQPEHHDLLVQTAVTKEVAILVSRPQVILVYDDADIDSAVEDITQVVWGEQLGLVGAYVLAQESVLASLVTKLKVRLETLRLGPPLDQTVDIGILPSGEWLRQMHDAARLAEQDGLTLYQPQSIRETLADKPLHPLAHLPTLALEAQPSHQTMQQVCLGMLLPISSFRTPEESLQFITQSPYPPEVRLWLHSNHLAQGLLQTLEACSILVNGEAVPVASSVSCGGPSGVVMRGGILGLMPYVNMVEPASEAPAEEEPVVKEQAKPKKRGRKPKPKPPEGVAATLDMYPFTTGHFIGAKTHQTTVIPYALYEGAVELNVAAGSMKEGREALKAAVKAEAWSKVTAQERGSTLLAWAEALAHDQQRIAAQFALMSAFSPDEALAEVHAGLTHLQSIAARQALACEKGLQVMGGAGLLRAHGVVVCVPDDLHVSPQGFYARFLTCVGTLLAAGNRVILVPSLSTAPVVSGLYSTFQALPAGVLNVVTGAPPELKGDLAREPLVSSLWLADAADAHHGALREAAFQGQTALWPMPKQAADDQALMLMQASRYVGVGMVGGLEP